MKLANMLRLAAGRRPRFPLGTTYVLDEKMGGDLMHAGGVTSYVIRAQPGGEQVGPVFETYDRAVAYREWLDGNADSFDWGAGAA